MNRWSLCNNILGLCWIATQPVIWKLWLWKLNALVLSLMSLLRGLRRHICGLRDLWLRHLRRLMGVEPGLLCRLLLFCPICSTLLLSFLDGCRRRRVHSPVWCPGLLLRLQAPGRRPRIILTLWLQPWSSFSATQHLRPWHQPRLRTLGPSLLSTVGFLPHARSILGLHH